MRHDSRPIRNVVKYRNGLVRCPRADRRESAIFNRPMIPSSRRRSRSRQRPLAAVHDPGRARAPGPATCLDRIVAVRPQAPRASASSRPAGDRARGRRGLDDSERRGRETRFSLTPELNRSFDEGIRRVYALAADPRAWDGRWLVLFVSIPTSGGWSANGSTARSSWAGLGIPAPGVLADAAHRAPAGGRARVDELGLRESIVVGRRRARAIGLSESELVRRAWDLADVATSYEELRVASVASTRNRATRSCSRNSSSRAPIRHFPFVDPQLPEALATALDRPRGDDLVARAQPDVVGRAHARWREIVTATVAARTGAPLRPRRSHR